ncbi:MAG TPA: ComEA family DNA-binding protein, partial [Acidimicrobiia bacterium]|nr:ComEA family DNA-binding protein [Acidimicrobiia bacterium]
MGELPLVERLHEWREDRRIRVALLACVAVACTFVWLRTAAAPASSPRAAPTTSPSVGAVHVTTSTSAAVIADVVGAVHHPGIVKLAAGARVIDAVRAAGGATARADLSRLNLAAVVADGTRIAVPKVGEPVPPLDGAPTNSNPPEGPVNLNTATAEQLDALPGVGPVLAQRIVDWRTAHGGFHSVDDLQQVSGIGARKF